MKTPAPADLQRWSDEVARDPASLAFVRFAEGGFMKRGGAPTAVNPPAAAIRSRMPLLRTTIDSVISSDRAISAVATVFRKWRKP